jgi:hypothetical protein
MDSSSSIDYIDVINRVTCKIETPNGIGTGVLINNEGLASLLLITAKHILYGESFNEDLKKDEIRLTLYNGQEIKLNESSEIVFTTDETDSAIIIIKELSELDIPPINLLNQRYYNGECIFRGYPQPYGNKRPINLWGKYSDYNLINVNTPLSTIDSDPLFNVQGFSGSGLFGIFGKEIYLFGILSKFEETFQLLHIEDLSFIEKIDHSLLKNLQFSSLPQNESIFNDIENFFNQSTRNFDLIKNRLAKKHHIERKVLQDRFEELFQKYTAITITGSAGAGKSAFAKSMLDYLSEQKGYKKIVLKAEQLAIDSLEYAFPNIENTLENVLAEIGKENQLIVLIDSAEKLIEVDNYTALKEFIELIKKHVGVKLIITCRTYAYQQLVYSLNNYLPTYRNIEIPPFEKDELDQVRSLFPEIKSFLSKKHLIKILSLPFYLNLVLSHIEQFLDSDTLSEGKLKKIIWDEIISKNSKKRGYLFENIALQRAKTMDQYVKIENADDIFIDQLSKDEIIDVEKNLKEAYRPAHDIYEDIALIRFVERSFQERDSVENFFKKLGGKQPAIRRAVRLWLLEKLETKQHILDPLIEDVLFTNNIDSYWQNEVLVSILRSTYCKTFFRELHDIISRNSYELLFKLINLLRTACQEPDDTVFKRLDLEGIDHNKSWIFLKPSGPGWEVVINYIGENINDLKNYSVEILDLLIDDWQKKLSSNQELPSEAEAVKDILLYYIEALRDSDSTNFSLSKEYIDEIVKVLLRVVTICEETIEKLIKESFVYQPQPLKDTQMKVFYRQLISRCLSGVYSREVCKIFPDLIIEMALLYWIETEEDELSGHRMSHAVYSDFGVTDDYDYRYFPADIYKTPTRFLLYYHPWKALEFIVEVINHATRVYSNSERGINSGVKKIILQLPDDTQKEQIGNEVIWDMYRGQVESVPGLIKSILMSLENYLLEICSLNIDNFDSVIEKFYLYLYKKSESVATTAVLSSVAMAYPQKIGRLCFPIIKVKEFYSWDRRRYLGDKTSFQESKDQPHRKKMLEFLVPTLQIYSFSKEVGQILDDFKKNAEDDTWKLILNRMDFRTYQLDDTIELTDENQFALTPAIDPKLKKRVDEAEENKILLLENELSSITYWAKKILDGELKNVDYKQWKTKYEAYLEIVSSHPDIMFPFGSPTNIAVSGLKLFNEEISAKELKWCLEIIQGVYELMILKDLNHDLSPISVFTEHLIDVFPETLKFVTKEKQKEKIKSMIFVSLIHFQNSEQKNVFDSVREKLWKVDYKFSQSCFYGLLFYSQQYEEHIKKLRENRSKKYTLKDLLEQYNEIIQKSLAEVQRPTLNELSIASYSMEYLLQAALLIPIDTNDKEHIKYLDFLIRMIPEKLSQDEYKSFKTHHLSTNKFSIHLSRIILSVKEKHSDQLFTNILDHLFNKIEHTSSDTNKFFSDFLENMIVAQNELNTNRFWKLWSKLAQKLRIHPNEKIIPYLFLSMRWWGKNQTDWKPLLGQKLYYKELVEDLGSYSLDSVLKLLSGIGSTKFLPEGLIWIEQILPKELKIQKKSNRFYYLENIVEIINGSYQNRIQRDPELRRASIYILNLLIESGSSKAFIMRDKFISIDR